MEKIHVDCQAADSIARKLKSMAEDMQKAQADIDQAAERLDTVCKCQMEIYDPLIALNNRLKVHRELLLQYIGGYEQSIAQMIEADEAIRKKGEAFEQLAVKRDPIKSLFAGLFSFFVLGKLQAISKMRSLFHNNSSAVITETGNLSGDAGGSNTSQQQLESLPEPPPEPEPPALDAGGVPKITAYGEGVHKGQIRYVSQTGETREAQIENGWLDYDANGNTLDYTKGHQHDRETNPADDPSGECGTASISMALSYIGVDKSPADVLEDQSGSTRYNNYTETDTSIGAVNSDTDFSTFQAKFDAYLQDKGAGNISPVVLHYCYPDGDPGTWDPQHAIVVIGKDENGYILADTARETNPVYGIQIEQIIDKQGSVSGKISGNNITRPKGAPEGAKEYIIDAVTQYVRKE